MPPSPPIDSNANPPPRRNFWQRRIADPIVAQLTQGLTPGKIALTIAIGSAIALFPLLGTTTLICLVVGIVMKLNQPIIQAVNYACTPLHLPFIVYAFRWGNRIFGTGEARFHLRTMINLLQEHPLEFLGTYSLTALHAIAIWLIVVPFWAVAVYYVTLPILRGIDRVRIETTAKAAAEKARDHPVP